MPLPRLRSSSPLFRRLAVAVIAATILVTVSGVFVRLTKSGLGCSDWPVCERDQFVADFDDVHATIEWVNRMLSGLLGLPILLLVVATALRKPFRRDLFGWSLGLLGAVLAEGLLGALVVKLHLQPLSVIGHFTLAMVILWNALVLEHRLSLPEPEPSLGHPGRVPLLVPERAFNLAWAGSVATALTLFAGTIVTGAGPHGGDTRAERLPFAIPSVARVHSLLGWLALVLLVGSLYCLYRAGAPASIRRKATFVSIAIIVQGAVGYTQYALDMPPMVVGLHVFGSTIVWLGAVRLVLACSGAPTPISPTEDQDALYGRGPAGTRTDPDPDPSLVRA